MALVYLLTGSNKGNCITLLKQAQVNIVQKVGNIIAYSKFYESEAWGKEDQANFVNQVLIVETLLAPLAVLKETQTIEDLLGRVRTEKWGSRTMDIDLLFYNDLRMDTERLTLPHPYLHQRRFTLVPLVALRKNLLHPVWKKTVKVLLEECEDELGVWVY